MKLVSRCIPVGSLPYESPEAATRMLVKFYEKLPYLSFLPKVSDSENILQRTLENIPGIKIHGENIKLKTGTSNYEQGLAKLDQAFASPTPANLEHFKINSAYMEKFIPMIKKFKSPNAVVNLLGPFSISQMLTKTAEEQMLVDKSYRKLFIQAVCVKALWAINKIKEACPDTTPLIILEEPLLGQIGDLKRENEEITTDLIVALLNKVVEKLKEAGADVGIQCLDKCDWQIPIHSGVDLISFDAYNNPNNLCIIPEQITEFISRGGKINWGIVPVSDESVIKNVNIDIVTKRLFSTLEGLILEGVPEKFVYNSAFVSVQGDTKNLPIIFAEKAIILANQLAKKIPIKS